MNKIEFPSGIHLYCNTSAIHKTLNITLTKKVDIKNGLTESSGML